MIREATERDAEEIERTLLHPSYLAIEAIDPSVNELAVDGPGEVDCGHWLDGEARTMFVAQDRGRLVGFVTVEVVDPPSLFARGPLANVDWLYVLPEFRRQGIATRLLERAETWAGDRGCEHVGITAHTANEPANRLYEERYGCTFRRYLNRIE